MLGFDLERRMRLREAQLALTQTKQELALGRRLCTLNLAHECQKGFILNGYITIVDFCIAKTIIEIDGSDHQKPAKAAKDTIRDAALQKLGYHVVRITNKEFDKMDACQVDKFIMNSIFPSKFESDIAQERECAEFTDPADQFTFYCRSHY